LIAGCGQHRLGQFPTGSGLTDEWPVNKTAQELVGNAVAANIANIGGEKYEFGKMNLDHAQMKDANGDIIDYTSKDINKACAIDLNKKLKIKYSSCDKVSGCKITIYADKACGLRPLIGFKFKYTPTELKGCQTLAHVRGIMSLKHELAMDDSELWENLPSNSTPLRVIGERGSRRLGMVKKFRPIDPALASYVGYLVLNNVSFKEIGVDPKKGSRDVVSIYSEKADATLVCLDNYFIQPSSFAQNISDKFIADKKLLIKIKAKIPEAKGAQRTNGNYTVEAFKIILELQ
jgi:hypothetical protein